MKISTLIISAIAIASPCAKADLSSGLVALFELNGDATDSSGNGNGASVFGLTLTSDRFGVTGGAYAFDKNGYIQLDSQNLMNGASSMSIAGWARNRLGSDEHGFVIGAGDGRSGLDPYTFLLTQNTIHEAIFSNTLLGDSHSDRLVGLEAAGIALQSGEWFSFVLQFGSTPSDSYFELYINGTLLNRTEYARPHIVSFDEYMPVQIGALTGFSDSQFRGDVDEIRIYDRVLTSSEIVSYAAIPESSAYVFFLSFTVLVFAATRRQNNKPMGASRVLLQNEQPKAAR